MVRPLRHFHLSIFHVGKQGEGHRHFSDVFRRQSLKQPGCTVPTQVFRKPEQQRKPPARSLAMFRGGCCCSQVMENFRPPPLLSPLEPFARQKVTVRPLVGEKREGGFRDPLLSLEKEKGGRE